VHDPQFKEFIKEFSARIGRKFRGRVYRALQERRKEGRKEGRS
jgi:hypothetical protein